MTDQPIDPIEQEAKRLAATLTVHCESWDCTCDLIAARAIVAALRATEARVREEAIGERETLRARLAEIDHRLHTERKSFDERLSYARRDCHKLGCDYDSGRRDALIEAAKDVCEHCGGRTPPYDPTPTIGPSGSGNWTHRRRDGADRDSLCRASTILWKLRAMAEGRPQR